MIYSLFYFIMLFFAGNFGFLNSNAASAARTAERKANRASIVSVLSYRDTTGNIVFCQISPRNTTPALNKLSIIIRLLICPLTRSFFYFMNIIHLSILTSSDYSLREVFGAQ